MIGNSIAGFLGAGVAASTTAYESIATTTVGAGGSTSISFSSIPGTYTHLQLRFISKSGGGAQFDIKTNFNSDTASNYSWHYVGGNGTSAAASAQTSIGFIYSTATLTSQFGAYVMDILDYANTNKYKTTRELSGLDVNGGGGAINLMSGNWRSTAAISSIQITGGTFAQYSSFALYGIKG